jgi:glutamate formiminotransferase / 5-formyltetrahydrofolate cyclo-ligase
VPQPPLLLTVPNASTGTDAGAVEAIAAAFAPASLLDVHSDPDHGRSVFTVAGRQGELAPALVRAALEARKRIDLARHAGRHPHVGVLDVAPIVHLDEARRGAACAEALTAAGLIGDEVGLPVFLYGELATRDEHRERASLRAGGVTKLAERVGSGELRPDYGPAAIDPSAGAVLVAARPPLVALNLDLMSDDLELARRIAGELREAGGGLPGVRAIGLELPTRRRAQVSVNVEDPLGVPLRDVVAFVRDRGEIAEAELVGLAPRAALDGFPDDVTLRGFDPHRDVIENALRSLGRGH